ncbi:elongation factor P [Gudongella oleilytica]|uniref:elongation factor P n=1 Tax=Gudongella oleilytica TaxID=1582259 RepID=UPI002A370163|nr:elongation factor P [Gudongella oleilytica]MDY0255743.1 elongation factor P [Gudongella oleilytica]
MIQAGEFRKGITFVMDGDVWQIIDFQHVKPGKGAAFVRAKIKNVLSGGAKEITFNPTERFEKAVIETKEMQYLYSDGELYHFMDTTTYEQLPLSYESVEEAIKYLRENDTAVIRFFQGKAFEVQAPNFVELEVTETEPGVKGDTAQGATKQAIVETGVSISVPLFVNIGDRIKIDTRTGEYLSRV